LARFDIRPRSFDPSPPDHDIAPKKPADAGAATEEKMRRINGFRALQLALAMVPSGQVFAGSSPVPHAGPVMVRVFNYSLASPEAIDLAIAEAARVFKMHSLPADWVNCSAAAPKPECISKSSQDPMIRVIAKALPTSGEHSLGMANRSQTGSTAAIFFERVQALRFGAAPLPLILGRAMAHEAIHVLLPEQAHLRRGLMKAQMSQKDFQLSCPDCSMLPSGVTASLRHELERRALYGDSMTLAAQSASLPKPKRAFGCVPVESRSLETIGLAVVPHVHDHWSGTKQLPAVYW